MDNVLFLLGDFPVTRAQAAIGAVIVLALLLVVVLVGVMRASAQRASEAAGQLAEQLRAGFLDQLADRDARIQALDHQVRVERERGADLL
ncbi:hypothetical protein N8D56_00510 [Devosia sp. A8/3-2]|nr:hypothetical protein N8D56_00510 [Devosia sp. A8/3-2]